MKPTNTNTLPTDLVGKLIGIDSNSFLLWKIKERLPTLASTYKNSRVSKLVRNVNVVVGMVVSVETAHLGRYSHGGFLLEMLSPDEGLLVVLFMYTDMRHSIKLLTQTKKST